MNENKIYLNQSLVLTNEKKHIFASLMCLLIFISFSISPNPFLSDVDDRNYVNIAVMCTAQLFFFLVKRISVNDILLIFFVLFVLISSLLHDKTSWTSSIYLVLFSSTFIIFSSMTKYIPINLDKIIKIVSLLIYAYFSVLILQQVSVLLAFPPPFAGNYSPDTPFKLSSIAAEPSVASISVGLITYLYIELKNYNSLNKSRFHNFTAKDYTVFFAALWVLLTSQSSTGVILSIFIALRLVNKLKIRIIVLCLLASLLIFLIYDFENVDRFFIFLKSLISLDASFIIETDHSASYRFIPAFLLFSIFDPFTIDGLFGSGNSFVGNYLYTVMPGTPPGHVAGGFATVLIQYGLIASIIFSYFLIKSCCRRKNIFDIFLIIIIVISINGINNQVFWLSIMVLNIIKMIYRNNSKN